MAPTLAMAKASVGYTQTLATVALAVTNAMAYFAPARRLPSEMVNLFAERILEDYPYESVADVSLFMRGVAAGKWGKHGQEGETYGQLDMQRLFVWWRQYLEEKAQAMERGEHELAQQQERHSAEVIAAIPGIKEAVKEFVISAKERSELVRIQKRINTLTRQLPTMTDDAMREAWKVYPELQCRALIQAEACRRGLMGEELKQAQLEADELERKQTTVA